MMSILLSFLLLSLCLISQGAWAIGLDVSLQSGLGSSQSTNNAGSKNDIWSFGVSAGGYIDLYRVFAVGVRADYRQIEQKSDPSLTSGGNRKGTRLMYAAPFF